MTNESNPFAHLSPELAATMQSVSRGAIHNGQFLPKLTLDERRGIYAAAKSGVNMTPLALVFGVNRRTITHMLSDNSKSYGPLKREYTGLGHTEFVTRYLTEAIAVRIQSGMNDEEIMAKVQLNSKQLDAEEAAKRVKVREQRGPSHLANSMMGVRSIKVSDGLSYRYEIKWLEEHPDVPNSPGWYFRGLDSDDPEFWQTSEPRAAERTGFWTSVEAFNHIRANGYKGN